MPINQGTMALSIGRDCQVVLIHPLADGGRLDLPNVTGFQANPEYTEIASKRLDGNRLHAALPDGWNGSFDLDRSNGDVDALMALVEAAWRDTGIIQSATVYQYITDPSGATATYEFTECSVTFPELGAWTADTKVTQKIAFRANRRNKLA